MALLNLRDVASSEGTRPLQPGRLFRSGQPFRLTGEDIAPIEGRVDTIVDLRDVHEVHDGEWDLMEEQGARVIHLPLAGQVMTMTSIASDDDMLGAFYVGMLENSGDALAEVARAVGSSRGVLLHCAAGKDRTGVATALLLDLLGVGARAIIADYERTNQAMPLVIAQLAEVYGYAGAVQGLDVTDGLDLSELKLNGIPQEFLQAPASAIERFLVALQQAGGARAYLTAVGLGAAELDQIVATLSAPRG